MNMRLNRFVAAADGQWQIRTATAIRGEGLPAARALSVLPGGATREAEVWALEGVTSNARYLTAVEAAALREVESPLGRPEATAAALIPIRKSPAWWAMSQDQRRRLVEEQGGHITLGMRYLPAIARRLFHCRDLGTEQPFDFLTWFEYAPQHEDDFDELVAALRRSPEWEYVDREVDLRLERSH